LTIDDLPTFGRPITATRSASPLLLGVGDAVDEHVEQVARALAVRRRHRHRLPRPEFVELVEVGGLRVVDLVGDHHPRLVRVAQEVEHAAVARVQAALRVHDQEEQVGLVDRLQHLPADLDVHGMSGSSVRPPVSTSQNCLLFHSVRAKWRSRVVPASSLTIAVCCPRCG
jgi:hypothetical protein